MSNAIPVIKFCFRSEWKSLVQALGMSQAYESEGFASPQELLSYVGAQPAALVICSLETKDDLVQIATLLKLAKKMRECVIRVVVLNTSKNKQFESALNKLGVQDILEASVSAKSLRFKMDLWMKALRTLAKPIDNPMAIKTAESTKRVEVENKLDDKLPQMLPALTIADDIWLQPRDFECKKVLGRWLMRLMGPGPYVAQWAEVSGKKNVWRFEFTQDNKAQFVKGSGDWYFRGEHKPEFNWKENLWYMTGETADLFYYETEVLTRLQLKDKVLSLAANSTFAKAKEKAILETFDKDLVFKNGAPEDDENEAVDNKADDLNSFMKGIESETQKSSSELQGKGKTDHLSQKDLSGKNNTAETSGDPLSGKSSTDHMLQNALKCKGKAAENRGGSALEMKLEHDDSFDGPYQGKSHTSQLGGKGSKGPASGGLTEGDLLDLENKNHQHETKHKGHFEPEKFDAVKKEKKEREAKAAKAQGPLAGKGATSQVDHSGLKGPGSGALPTGSQLEQETKNHQHETKYKGHFEPEIFEALEKEKKEREKSAEGAGPMSGKTSTPKLDHKGHQGPGSGSLNEGALLDLENKTHTHETKYKGHHEAEKFQAKEARKNQYHEDDLGGEYGGKSETDRLKKHYQNRTPLDHSADESEEASEDTKTERNAKKKTAQRDESAADESNLLDFSPAAKKDSKRSAQTANVKTKASAEALDTPDPEMEEATQTGIVTAFMVFQNKRIACELDDFFEDQAIFRLPTCQLKDQDSVDLDLSFDYLKKLTQIKLAGVVSSHDVTEDTSYVSVTLDSKRVQEFDSFMKIYQKRQQNVEFFMKKVKGL